MQGGRAADERSGRFLQGLIALLLVASACGVAGCDSGAKPSVSIGLTPDKHSWFTISAGTAHELGRAITEGKMACQSCHPSDTTSFTQIMCVNCHGHEEGVMNRIHTTVAGYAYGDSAACYSCHPTGGKTPFDHGDITSNCAMCHDVGTQFAALPKPDFTHPATGGSDCGGCHNISAWKGATGGPASNTHDPANDLLLTALVPTFTGTSISNLTPVDQTLSMSMDHGSMDMPTGAMSACANCHPDSSTSVYFPGNFHSSMANLELGEPTSCGSCHLDAMPIGLVGPAATNPARNPTSGEMKHDAVVWANGAPTTNRLVSTDCGLCHSSPSSNLASAWSTSKAGTPIAQFHPALTAAGSPQPTSCVDCHANSRPKAILDSTKATLPAGLQFDHGGLSAQGDCAGCHATGGATQFSSWKQGKFHLTGGANPTTCLPCHAGERPTSTTTWASPTYRNAPFDYVTNATGTTHGDGQDCAGCHTGAGTGAWGGSQNWMAGRFSHGAQTVARTTCIACHSTQRPDVQTGATAASASAAIGFDHALNGTGECFGCHQATVSANTFVNYTNPTTRALPGGDWKGGQGYPGSSYSGSSDQFIQLLETTLVRDSATNLVLGTTSIGATIYNGMLHISSIIPAVLQAGPTATPDNTRCWHCHTSSNGTVTAYKNGQYHASLTTYRATPAGAVAPFAQPTSQCADCHTLMTPAGIVEKGASSLWPMDHSAMFATPITVAGAVVSGVSQIDCSVCHKSPGDTWADGTFHPNVGSGVVSDCVSCHYMLIADTTLSDVQNDTLYVMKHASKQLTFQTCQKACHPGAVGTRALLPATSDLWKGGAVHSTVTAQPVTCLDCHGVSQPATNASTQSSWSYALAAGGTTTNRGQWMNHGSLLVAGRDCAACHLADSQATGAVWNKATYFHTPGTSPPTCRECHGLLNGGGAVAGTNNNLPVGLTNSTEVTTATTASHIPAGTLAQISHADINAATRDCNFCHSQQGVSTAPAIQGKEWAQARFHAPFTITNPLVMNTTTGRCSNCHMNDNPPASYTPLNHTVYTNASGSTDCSSCHAYPGTGTVGSPNWLGAANGAPSTISVGGFVVARPPATTTVTQTGISDLPHPTIASTTACTTCHPTVMGGRNAMGYDHLSTLMNANCDSCHEAGSNLVATAWNAATTTASGAGDTRPASIAGIVPSYKGNTRALAGTATNHFFPADCHECHVVPPATGQTTTGATYRTTWQMNHDQSKMKNPATCNMCHAAPNSIPEN